MAKQTLIAPDGPALKVEMWPLAKVKPYEKNARLHSEEQVEQIAKSIDEFGMTTALLVDEKGVLIYGHGRYHALMLRGFNQAPVMVARKWTEARKKAYRIADNQLTLNAEWDTQLLRAELTELNTSGFDLTLLGFNDLQIVQFTAGISEKDPEATPAAPANPVSKRGDVWLLGRHRLLCGDATDAKDVKAVLGKAKPHLMVTDPPYGVSYDPAWRTEPGKLGSANSSNFTHTHSVRRQGLQNDNMADWTDAWKLFPGDVVYVWHGGLYASVVERSLQDAKFETRAQIVWMKQLAPISRGDYHWKHECCWYMVRKGSTSRWSGDRKQNTVWEIVNSSGFSNEEAQTEHATQKPIECMKRPIENNSKPGDAVYDPFVGSGTTIVAAEMTARACAAIELDPAYVDVAVQRWQTFAGKAAALEGDGRTFADVAKARQSTLSKKRRSTGRPAASAA